MSKLKNKKAANNASAIAQSVAGGVNSNRNKRPDELVLDIDCRKKPKDDDTIRYILVLMAVSILLHNPQFL